MTRPFRLGEASRDLQAAALAWARTPTPGLLHALKYFARRFARELERMQAKNGGGRR